LRGGRGRPDASRGRSSGPPGARAAGGRGRPAKGSNKRTSRNTDDRNPTRSGIQYPSPRYRSREASSEPVAPKERASLRRVRRGGGDAAAPVKATKRSRKAAPTRRRPVRSTEASVELRRVAGRGASRALQELERAAEAFNAGHERDALRIMRPLREAYPEVAAIRELLGLSHYRLGQFPAAARELGHFADLTGSVDQHPVLMDCARSQRRYGRVESLWDELSAASPSAALVTEGRIVLAGSLADRGRLREAIALLERRGNGVQRPADHHLRLWYTLADLCERSGDLPRARELFDRVRRRDAAFADVAERLVALS
jgi:tetratricopeptide (TPR) repeat protein